LAARTASPHTAFQQLPLLDISPLYSDDPRERRRSAEQLGNAARDAGFFYVTGHRVPTVAIDRLVARTRAYFALPLADKMRHYIGRSSNHSGYVPEGEEQFDTDVVDRKEAYDIGFDYLDEVGRRPMLGPNQWPDMPGFKEDIKAYYDAVLTLSQRLFRGFALALGLEEERLLRHVTTPPSQLRLIHYRHDAASAGGQGIGAHTDYECFTILLPTAPGLEVVNGAGQWIDVPVVAGAFVINIGDMLEVLSNGAFVATRHRVRRVAEERYAFPLFCACDYDTVIEPLLPRAATAGPNPYTPVVCGEHLYARTRQTFAYLKRGLSQGEPLLPDSTRARDSFGPREEAL
jgi:isopenicillin N synthase-like dioxygenase